MMGKKYVKVGVALLFTLVCVFIITEYSLSSEETKKDSRTNYAKFLEEKTHWCTTMVISCSDFRFGMATQELVNNVLGFMEDYDYFAIPGSIKNMLNSETRELVLSTFGISVQLHHVKRIVIITHEDCIGYGGSRIFGTHKEEEIYTIKDMKKARRLMRIRFPHLKVHLFYGKIISEGEKRVYKFEQID